MKYTVTRNGQNIGTHTLEELRALTQRGQILSSDVVTPLTEAHPVNRTPVAAAAVAPAPTRETRPVVAVAPEPEPPEEYLVQRGPEQFGPYPREQFLEYARAGNFGLGDLAWRPGMAIWEPVATVVARMGGGVPQVATGGSDETMKWLLPVGRSGLAIAAGYLGLFSILLLPAPVALIVGILALRDLKKNPTKSGAGRAWFGTIAGALGTLFILYLIIRS